MSDASPVGGEPRLLPTPAQTVGPFFGYALPWEQGPFAVAPSSSGAIRVGGLVLDGAGTPVTDALVETWGADPSGRFAHPADPRGAVEHNGFRGFARSESKAEGRFEIVTLKPGPTPGPGTSTQAPHLVVSIFARGILRRLVTRIYFEDEPELNAADPVLAALPEGRRGTLVATAEEDGYRFDIRLQGEHETVFFAV